MARKKKPVVFPELIDPTGEWIIEPWQPSPGMPCPCTDNTGRRMYVPSGNSPFAREVCFHELLHVKYSPKEVPSIPGITARSILAAEDCRINLLGSLIREHDALGATPMQDAITIVTSTSERGMAQLTAACLGYASTGEWLDNLDEQLDGIRAMSGLPLWLRLHARELQQVVSSVRCDAPDYFTNEHGDIDQDVATFAATLNLAAWLDTFADTTGPPAPSSGTDNEDGEYDEGADGEGGNASRATWGTMKVEAPPLTVRHKVALGRRSVPSLGGTRIAHYNRAATGEIFGRTVKRAVPDAVLIDQSGSMHWEADQLVDLVGRMPVGIIAGYAGEGGKGVLRILAKDGRMVPPDRVEHESGGNEIDGPALRWLARQPGRRVWVSDQGVCTDQCDSQEDLMADCQAIIDGAGIKVCLSTDPAEIIRTLRGTR